MTTNDSLAFSQAPTRQSGATDKPRRLSRLAQATVDIVLQAKRRGQADMTLAELVHALRQQAAPGRTVEKSSLSRELTFLADEGLLLRRATKRKSAWEALPVGVDQASSPASYAYYLPGTVAAPVAAVAGCY